MPDTILANVKIMLGIPAEYTPYDQMLVMHINSVFMILNQLGVGVDGFKITLADPLETGTLTSNETWNNFFGPSYTGDKEAVKSYLYTKVRLLFDPPASGTLMESLKKLADEFEFRLNVAAGV